MEPVTDDGLELRLWQTYTAEDSPWHVPAYRFNIIHNGETAGTISVCITTDRTITHLAGQVGFVIEEQHRGQGLAGRAASAGSIHPAKGLVPVWFTTTADNAAARRTLEKLGAELAGTTPIPPTYPSYQEGQRKKLVYRLDSEML